MRKYFPKGLACGIRSIYINFKNVKIFVIIY